MFCSSVFIMVLFILWLKRFEAFLQSNMQEQFAMFAMFANMARFAKQWIAHEKRTVRELIIQVKLHTHTHTHTHIKIGGEKWRPMS